MKTTAAATFLLIISVNADGLRRSNERDLGVLCTGFTVIEQSGTSPLVEGMTIYLDDTPEWEIQANCPGATSSVITKLYDKTTSTTIRRGNDKNKANGFFWNAAKSYANPTVPKFTDTADELIPGHKYCFYAYVDAAAKPDTIVCFYVEEESCDCDDGNPCNGVEVCAASGCVAGTPVTCPTDQSCDPLDGLCKDNRVLRPCIAVIDESDNYSPAQIDAKWAAFRASYPERYFCLLQPQIPNTGYDGLHRPAAFDADPRTTFKVVARDGGNVALASDWFAECGYDTLSTTGIDFVALFIDNSGSMYTSTVQASFNKFKADMTAASLSYCFVTNPYEDWITPFSTTLGDTGGGGTCG